jgi:hypothetical protein
MSDEEINETIAAAIGLVSFDQWGGLYKTDAGYVRTCPSYCSDLNAMHEAEKMLLDTEDWVGYHDELRDMIFPVWHATARQRAEAFLRTINKWKE